MDNFEVIHTWVYDVSMTTFIKSNANEKSEYTKILCSNKENCTFFKRNECLLLALHIFSNAKCPYGKKIIEKGYTKRAQKNRSWCDKRQKEHPDKLNKLHKPMDALAKIGDYVFLPYSLMNKNDAVPYLSHNENTIFGTGEQFILYDDFIKPETIKKIVHYRPRALFTNSPIREYAEKTVPLFIKHLSEFFPDVYDNANVDNCLDEIIANFSNIGRYARVQTLKKGCKIKKEADDFSYTWDGTNLVANDNVKLLFPIIKYEHATIIIHPKKDSTIKITSDDQVDENTEFVK
jgi:hypothetical protein